MFAEQSFCHALVTGGCGFIGHHLVVRLLDRGISVTVLDDLSTGCRSNLPEHDALRLIEGSVLDRAAVRRAAAGADVIFHLASMVGMRRVSRDPRETFRISTEGTRNLLAVSGTTPLIAFSSSSVYGLETAGRVAEDDVVDGVHALTYDGGRQSYASGKWVMERMVLATQAKRPVLILRPFNVVGERQSGSYGMVVPRFLTQARAGEPLTIYGDGKQNRCFSCVHGFADRVLSLLERPAAWRAPLNVLNIGDDRPTAIGELAGLIIEELSSPSKLRTMPYAEVYPGRRDVRRRVPDLRRIEGLLGKEPWPDVRTLLRRLIAADSGDNGREQVCG